jgi:hypothetical protein
MKKIFFTACLLVAALVTSSFTGPPANQKLIRDYYRAYEKRTGTY